MQTKSIIRFTARLGGIITLLTLFISINVFANQRVTLYDGSTQYVREFSSDEVAGAAYQTNPAMSLWMNELAHAISTAAPGKTLNTPLLLGNLINALQAVSGQNLETDLFPYISTVPTTNILGSFTTKYNANVPRAINVALAANRINGVVIPPGQTFSLTEQILPRTTANGYVVGPIYINGTVSEGIGGGICQVSSTLYAATLYTGIIPIQRHNHSLPVNYMGAGLDATISGKSLDFKFKNPFAHPITIFASADNGVLTINILGDASDLGGYTYAPIVETIAPKNVKTYLAQYLNGVETGRVYLNSSKYK